MFHDILTKEISLTDKYVTPECFDFLEMLLKKDPTQRLGFNSGISEIKQHKFLSDISWLSLSLYNDEIFKFLKIDSL